MSPGDGTAERVMLWQSPPATDPASSSGLGLPVTERVNVTGGWHSRVSHAVAVPSRCGLHLLVRPRVASGGACPMPPGGGAAEPVMLRQSPPAAAPYSTSGPGIARDGGRLPVTLLEPLEPRQEMRKELCHKCESRASCWQGRAGTSSRQQQTCGTRPARAGRGAGA